jgi:hypothetical protein
MAQTIKRKIWCNDCDQPTNNIIEYRGTEKKEGVVYAVFYSMCCRCMARKKGTKQRQVVSVEDYSALISREIYA